jgi:hypothetical protein
VRISRVSGTAIHRRQLLRLRALGAEFEVLGRAESHEVRRRFAEQFVDPAELPSVIPALLARALDGRCFAFDRVLRPDGSSHPTRAVSSLRWLTADFREPRCHRFEPYPNLPALAIVATSLEEAWAASWPGVIVSFETRRALVVTLDYERIHCDLGGRSPYR